MRKRSAVIGFVASVLVAAAAIAYFTTTGSGTGSASVGSSTALSITQTNTISGLTPGAAAQSVAYTIANPSGKGAQNLGKVTISNIAVTPATGKTCAASNFQANDPSAAVGTIADGASYTSVSGTQPSVQMIESGTNQDGCQGASLSLTLSAAQGS